MSNNVIRFQCLRCIFYHAIYHESKRRQIFVRSDVGSCLCCCDYNLWVCSMLCVHSLCARVLYSVVNSAQQWRFFARVVVSLTTIFEDTNRSFCLQAIAEYSKMSWLKISLRSASTANRRRTLNNGLNKGFKWPKVWFLRRKVGRRKMPIFLQNRTYLTWKL